MLASVDLGSRGLYGATPDTVQHECQLYANSTNNMDISLFANHEWIHSTWVMEDNMTVFALTHNEYHCGECFCLCRRLQLRTCLLLFPPALLIQPPLTIFHHSRSPFADRYVDHHAPMTWSLQHRSLALLPPFLFCSLFLQPRMPAVAVPR